MKCFENKWVKTVGIILSSPCYSFSSRRTLNEENILWEFSSVGVFLCYHLIASRLLIYQVYYWHGSSSKFSWNLVYYLYLLKTCENLTSRIFFELFDAPTVICALRVIGYWIYLAINWLQSILESWLGNEIFVWQLLVPCV